MLAGFFGVGRAETATAQSLAQAFGEAQTREKLPTHVKGLLDAIDESPKVRELMQKLGMTNGHA